MTDSDKSTDESALPMREFYISRGKLALAVLVYFGFVIFGCLTAAGNFGQGTGHYAGLAEPVGVLLAAMGGSLAVLGMWQLLTWRGPVISFSPVAISDRYVSDSPIPWSAIKNVTPYRYRGKLNGVRLQVSPEFMERFPLRASYRVMGAGKQSIGADYVTLRSGSSSLDASQLYDLTLIYWTRYSSTNKVTG